MGAGQANIDIVELVFFADFTRYQKLTQITMRARRSGRFQDGSEGRVFAKERSDQFWAALADSIVVAGETSAS